MSDQPQQPQQPQRVHILQCLCPERHCIMALPYLPGVTVAGGSNMDDIILDDTSAVEFLRSIIETGFKSGALRPVCNICGAQSFIYEVGVTRFSTMEEAEPHIRRLEEENMRARQYFENFNRAKNN